MNLIDLTWSAGYENMKLPERGLLNHTQVVLTNENACLGLRHCEQQSINKFSLFLFFFGIV